MTWVPLIHPWRLLSFPPWTLKFYSLLRFICLLIPSFGRQICATWMSFVLVPRVRLFGLSSSWRAQLHLPHLPMSAMCLPFLVSHRLDERATPATLRPLIVDHSLPTAGVAPPPCHSISHLQLVSLLLSSLCISHRRFSLRVHHRSSFGSYFT